MQRLLHPLLLAGTLFLLVGCSERERVTSDYVLVTEPQTNPDGHPGTKLYRGEKLVWGNVYTGYFLPGPASSFARDGMMVFVGPPPIGDHWYYFPQLFAIRGDGPPVVLTERLLHQRLAPFDPNHEGSTFGVQRLSPSADGFQVVFEGNSVTKTCDVSWADIAQLLDEADRSARYVHHPLSDYRILQDAGK